MKQISPLLLVLVLAACAKLDQKQRQGIGYTQDEIGLWSPPKNQPLLPPARKFTNAPSGTNTPPLPYPRPRATNTPAPVTKTAPAKKQPLEPEKRK